MDYDIKYIFKEIFKNHRTLKQEKYFIYVHFINMLLNISSSASRVPFP